MPSDFGEGILPDEPDEPEAPTPSEKKQEMSETEESPAKRTHRSRSRRKPAKEERETADSEVSEEAERDAGGDGKPRSRRRRRSVEEKAARRREVAKAKGEDIEEPVKMPGAGTDYAIAQENDVFGEGLLPPEELDTFPAEELSVPPEEEEVESAPPAKVASEPARGAPRSRGGSGRGRGKRDREDEGPRRSRRSRRGERTEGRLRAGSESAPAANLPIPLLRRSSQRVAILVDLDGLDREAHRRFEGELSTSGLLDQLCRGRLNPRAIAYLSKGDRSRQEVLRAQGFDTLAIEKERKRCLVRLAMDAVAVSTRVDAIAIASTDTALLPLVEHLINLGLKVEFAGFDTTEGLSEIEATGAHIVTLGSESVLLP